jgi:thiol-disulfide isomerase/thioredoxin
MKLLFLSLTLVLVLPVLHAEDSAAKLEQQVAALVAGPQVTVVHFWAPWCPNCREEMRPEGWAKFVAANPAVKVIFLNIWHKGQDPAPKLAAGGLGPQPNLLLLTHPNPARVEADRLNSFLGLPLTWIPATWVFRGGKLCVAFNYGEIRFPVLQQMVDDARESWDR